MKEAIPIMRRQGGGAIVNISSGTASMILPHNGPYSGLKKALAHLSLTARAELAEDKIVVSAVYPFITLTDFEKNTIKDPSLQEHEKSLKQKKPSTKLMRPICGATNLGCH